MAWSDAARKAAAEARRRKAKTRGAQVYETTSSRMNPMWGIGGRGTHAFELKKGGVGAPHTVYMRSMKLTEAKTKLIKLAKRISVKTKQPVWWTRLP